MLPKALLTCYFVGAAAQSIPMVAFGVFLNDEIKMPLDEQARFYATIFLPWSLKPLYSYIMDNFRLCGSRRRYYIALANVGFGFSFLATAFFTTNVAEMYLFSLLRSSLEAFSECGLGLVLIDIVGTKRTSGSDAAQVAQAQGSASRMAGSLAAYIIGLLIYGCGTTNTISSRTIIAATSLLTIFTTAAALMLPEPPTEKEIVIDSLPQESCRPEVEVEEIQWTWQSRLRVGLGIIAFQFLFVWIGVQNMVPVIPWATVLSLWMAVLLVAAVVGLRKSLVSWGPLSCAVLLFLLSASPTYGSPWFSFQLASFNSSMCQMQILLIIGEAASLLGCWSFPALTRRCLSSSNETNKKKRAELAMIFFTILGCLVGLLDVLLALDWTSFLASPGSVSILLQFGGVSFLGSFLGQLSFLSRQVYATEHSYDNAEIGALLTPGMLYGGYLSLVDFGDSASGWISSPLTSALDLSYSSRSYRLLWAFVVISVVWELLTALLAPPLLRLLGRCLERKRLSTYEDIRSEDLLAPEQALSVL